MDYWWLTQYEYYSWKCDTDKQYFLNIFKSIKFKWLQPIFVFLFIKLKAYYWCFQKLWFFCLFLTIQKVYWAYGPSSKKDLKCCHSTSSASKEFLKHIDYML